jgi:hypothetical protein
MIARSLMAFKFAIPHKHTPMTTTLPIGLTQPITAISTAVSALQSFVTPYTSSSPTQVATIEQQLTIITNALATIQATATAATTPPTPTPTPVTPIVPVTPTTPMVTSPSSGLSGLGFTSDDFTSYSSTKALLAQISSNIGGTGNYLTCLYNDGYNGQLVSLDTSVLYNGHQTMKYTFPAGVQTYPGLWVNFQNGKSLTKMWFRSKIRFAPGFTTTGVTPASQPNGANAYKLLGWAWNTYDGSGRLEISNTTQYYLYWDAISKSGTNLGGGTSVNAGSIVNEWTDGNWYDYIIYCDFSQGTTGIARVWMAIDGQTPTLKGTSSGSLAGNVALPGITAAYLGLNFNQTRAANEAISLNYGQWEVVDGVAHSDPYNLLSQVK